MTWNRRQFFGVSGAAALTTRAAAAQGTRGELRLAGLLANFAFFDDAVALAMFSADVGEAAKRALTGEPDIVRLAGLMPSAPAGLERPVNRVEAKGAQARPQLLALVLGRRIQDSFDRHLAVKPGPGAAECRLYRDVFVLKQLTSGARPASAADLASLFGAVDRRAMIGFHTFNPDGSDPEGWLERVFDWAGDRARLIRGYADVYAAPDEAKMQEHVLKPNYYNRDDLLIRVARSLGEGRLATRADLSRAVPAAKQGSLWARALAEALRSLAAAPA